MANDRSAPDGTVWVCGACGKTARDLYAGERGWDESCMLNAVLCDEASIVRNEHGRVTSASAALKARSAS